MKKVSIFFSKNKIDCVLEEEIVNKLIDAFLEGKHKTIILNMGSRQIIIVCDKIDFIEIKE